MNKKIAPHKFQRFKNGKTYCFLCNKYKKPTEFYKSKRRKPGYCKNCEKLRKLPNFKNKITMKERRMRVGGLNYDFLASLQNQKKYYCNICEKIKSLDNFMKRKSAINGYGLRCYSCISKKSVEVLNKRANSGPLGYLKETLSQNKYWAKVRKIKSELSLDDLIKIYKKQKGICKLTKIKLTFIKGKGRQAHNASIDRINSKKHYCIENVRLITDIANRATYNFTDQKIKKFAKLVLLNLK